MACLEPCFTHTTRFRSPSMEVKSLDCASPADPIGFTHEYEASRISLVRSGVFGRVVRGASLLADSTQVLFVNRGDVHRFVHPVAGGDACTVLEVCPSSNVQTGATASWPLHPIDRLQAAGVPLSVSTDTRGLSQATLTKEYALLTKHFGWSAAHLVAANQAALCHAFIGDDTRTGLLSRLQPVVY